MNLTIGNRLVGDGEPCFIVAEIGENYVGNPDVACALIKAAAESGADGVKIQTITAEELYNPSSPGYARRKQNEMDLAHFPQLVEAAQEHNIILFSTPFDELSADFLDGMSMPVFKIGSGELTHHSFLRHVAQKGKPIVVSTGMAEQSWIDTAIEVVTETGNNQVIVTHCVSSYPAGVELANVNAIPALRERLGILTGYSDHTMTSAAAFASVALGSCYLEKHFTLSRTYPGADNSMSAEPGEFQAMVAGIREVEAALGKKERTVLPAEEFLIPLARRGIYARRDINSGERLEASMLAVRRPLSAIPANDMDAVIGKVAAQNIPAEEGLTWEQISA
jgi:N,N'-diacetyllegionaminate synthase